MSVEENLRVVAAVEDALNRRDLDRFESMHLNSVIQRDPAHTEPLKGSKAIRESLEPFLNAFPDLRMTRDQAFGQGDWIALHGHFDGTHRAPLEVPGGPAIPATNRTIRVPYALMAKLEGGKLAEVNVFYDQMAMMTQLGLSPQMPAENQE